jgi:NhaP-type Na+/H+ or K+/H+ antiporter
MTITLWFLLVGVLMLTRGLGTSTLAKFPFTPAIIYFLVGVSLGPSGLGAFYFNPLEQAPLLELVTEIAVLISLFSAGVKMPVPVNFAQWSAPLRLASLSIVVTVGLVTAFSFFVLGLPLGAGILIGAILAPTDPVLATDVQSRHVGDKDQLRFTLTCEAGMNDGTAFPFVVLGLGLLGLHEIGDFGWRWIAIDVVWATAGAVAIGIASGVGVAQIVWKLRGDKGKQDVLDDLVALGLIAIVYGISVSVSTWGFLAVFFAAVALRQTELKLARSIGVKPEALEAPVPAGTSDEQAPPTIVSVEALIFKEHLERLSELMLVLLLGGMVTPPFWNWKTVGLALFILFIARPLSTFVALIGTETTWRMKGLVAWFGVRGIGSIYYLMYAIQQGLPLGIANELIQCTLIVVAISILVHGTSVKPLLNLFWRSSRQKHGSGR